jgi:hypothetical protein
MIRERGRLKQSVQSRTAPHIHVLPRHSGHPCLSSGIRFLASLAGCAILVAYLGGADAAAQIVPPNPVPTATPIPSATLNPVPPTASPVPTATPPPPRGRRGRPSPSSGPKSPEPTATPTSPAFASLDGTWEVQVQYSDHTNYGYFDVLQTTSTLTGNWRYQGKKFPMDGTYDGRLIKMVAKLPQGNVTLSGYVENATDMVGLIDFNDGKTPIAFTAEHRQPPSKNLLNRGEPEAGGGRHRGGQPQPQPTHS